jgi:hypothetical protein
MKHWAHNSKWIMRPRTSFCAELHDEQVFQVPTTPWLSTCTKKWQFRRQCEERRKKTASSTAMNSAQPISFGESSQLCQPLHNLNMSNLLPMTIPTPHEDNTSVKIPNESSGVVSVQSCMVMWGDERSEDHQAVSLDAALLHFQERNSSASRPEN